jgi:hypothetical protein
MESLQKVQRPRMMQKLMQRRQAEEVSAAGKTYRVSNGIPAEGPPLQGDAEAHSETPGGKVAPVCCCIEGRNSLQ